VLAAAASAALRDQLLAEMANTTALKNSPDGLNAVCRQRTN
jgi:hypothetical protein